MIVLKNRDENLKTKTAGIQPLLSPKKQLTCAKINSKKQ